MGFGGLKSLAKKGVNAAVPGRGPFGGDSEPAPKRPGYNVNKAIRNEREDQRRHQNEMRRAAGRGRAPVAPKPAEEDTGLTLQQIIDLLNEQAAAAERERAFSTSQTGMAQAAADEAAAAALAHQRDLEQLRLQQEFERQQEAARLEAQRQVQLAELKQQRQATFVDMLGRDPVRAVLFALGLGPEADTFNVSARQLGETLQPMEGAQQKEQEHEGALKGLLGSGKYGTKAGANVDIGTGGVTGLGPAHKAARAFAQGGMEAQKLLTSAFGVGGNKPGEGGLSPESLLQKVQSVTPKGMLDIQ